MDGYAAAREGSAVFDLPDRALIAVSGPLRQKFLHNILSNDVASRTAGQGARAALMDVKGHLLAFLRVVVDPGEILLEVAGGQADAVEQALVHYRVAAPVRFARPPLAVIGLLGPGAADILRGLGADVSDLVPESHVTADLAGTPMRVVRASDLPAGGYVLYVPVDAREAVITALRDKGTFPIERAALDVLRIEEGLPWFGPDVTEENLLHETLLVKELHSSTKGCYVGQEVIARLEARGGNVNKLLRGLRLAAPCAAGDAVHAAGKEVGRVTTAGVSPELGAIAMAYVHRSAAEPGTAVLVSSGPATVARLPLRDR